MANPENLEQQRPKGFSVMDDKAPSGQKQFVMTEIPIWRFRTRREWFVYQLKTLNYGNIALIIVIVALSITVNQKLDDIRLANSQAQSIVTTVQQATQTLNNVTQTLTYANQLVNQLDQLPIANISLLVGYVQSISSSLSSSIQNISLLSNSVQGISSSLSSSIQNISLLSNSVQGISSSLNNSIQNISDLTDYIQNKSSISTYRCPPTIIASTAYASGVPYLIGPVGCYLKGRTFQIINQNANPTPISSYKSGWGISRLTNTTLFFIVGVEYPEQTNDQAIDFSVNGDTSKFLDLIWAGGSSQYLIGHIPLAYSCNGGDILGFTYLTNVGLTPSGSTIIELTILEIA